MPEETKKERNARIAAILAADPTADTRTEEEITAQEAAQQALQSAEEGGGMHRPSEAYPTKKQKSKGFAKGGKVRGCGIARRGLTKGKMY